MELKKPLSFDEQVEKLIEHKMIISDKEAAINILRKINYYRFTGYALQYRLKPNDSEYKQNTTFEKVYSIYRFDERLRDIFRRYIEIAEVYYRTCIAYGFSMTKCMEEPYDQHYSEDNFYYKDGYNEVMESLKKEELHYKDSLIVKHHKAKYENRMPLWVIVELLSFSHTSKLYNSMYISEKDIIAKSVGISSKTLSNHLHCMSVLRNKCAHAARLYNTEFYPPAIFTKQFLAKNPQVNNKSLFAYILILLKRLPDLQSKRALITDIVTVITEFEEDIDFSLIGFPKNFVELMENNLK